MGLEEWEWMKELDKYELKCVRDAQVEQMGSMAVVAMVVGLGLLCLLVLGLLLSRLWAGLGSLAESQAALALLCRTAKAVPFPRGHAKALSNHYQDYATAIAKLSSNK